MYIYLCFRTTTTHEVAFRVNTDYCANKRFAHMCRNENTHVHERLFS